MTTTTDVPIRPFQFRASDEALADLRRRIAATNESSSSSAYRQPRCSLEGALIVNRLRPEGKRPRPGTTRNHAFCSPATDSAPKLAKEWAAMLAGNTELLGTRDWALAGQHVCSLAISV